MTLPPSVNTCAWEQREQAVLAASSTEPPAVRGSRVPAATNDSHDGSCLPPGADDELPQHPASSHLDGLARQQLCRYPADARTTPIVPNAALQVVVREQGLPRQRRLQCGTESSERSSHCTSAVVGGGREHSIGSLHQPACLELPQRIQKMLWLAGISEYLRGGERGTRSAP